MPKVNTIKYFFNSLLYLIYPENCLGCDEPLIEQEEILCVKCFYNLPAANFNNLKDNPVSKLFWGRINFEHATSLLKYYKKGIAQKLLQQLKYHGKTNIGIWLGKQLGNSILKSEINNVDMLIPIPLNPKKQFKRGYNQSEFIAKGINKITGIPIYDNIVIRKVDTDTQTLKSRYERWENVSEIFAIKSNREALKNKHALIIDDVVTTGSTLEACGHVLLNNGAKQVSVATVAYAAQ